MDLKKNNNNYKALLKDKFKSDKLFHFYSQDLGTLCLHLNVNPFADASVAKSTNITVEDKVTKVHKCILELKMATVGPSGNKWLKTKDRF